MSPTGSLSSWGRSLPRLARNWAIRTQLLKGSWVQLSRPGPHPLLRLRPPAWPGSPGLCLPRSEGGADSRHARDSNRVAPASSREQRTSPLCGRVDLGPRSGCGHAPHGPKAQGASGFCAPRPSRPASSAPLPSVRPCPKGRVAARALLPAGDPLSRTARRKSALVPPHLERPIRAGVPTFRPSSSSATPPHPPHPHRPQPESSSPRPPAFQ